MNTYSIKTPNAHVSRHVGTFDAGYVRMYTDVHRTITTTRPSCPLTRKGKRGAVKTDCHADKIRSDSETVRPKKSLKKTRQKPKTEEKNARSQRRELSFPSKERSREDETSSSGTTPQDPKSHWRLGTAGGCIGDAMGVTLDVRQT